MPQPKFFFDTQIFTEVERGGFLETDWRTVLEYVRKTGEYWISPLTLTELLWGLQQAAPEHFLTHQRRLALLYAKGNKHFFDFIRYQLAAFLGVRCRRPAHLEDNFALPIEIVLWANSKKQLATGVNLPHMTCGVKLRLDRFQFEIQSLQNRFVSLASSLAGTPKRRYSLTEWTARVLAEYSLPNDPSYAASLSQGLSSA